MQAADAKGDAGEFAWEGEANSAPLKLWVMRRTEPDKPINKSRANEELPAAVASEIVRWLQAGTNGKARVEGKPWRRITSLFWCGPTTKPAICKPLCRMWACPQ